MNKSNDMQAEARMFWTVVKEAREQQRAGIDNDDSAADAIDELSAIQQWTEWPKLRDRLSEASNEMLRAMPAREAAVL